MKDLDAYQVDDAVANTTPKSVAGKALSTMSKGGLEAVGEDLKKRMRKNTSHAVKTSVVQVQLHPFFCHPCGYWV